MVLAAALIAYQVGVLTSDITATPSMDVKTGFACGNNAHKYKFVGKSTLAACESACIADPLCRQFEQKAVEGGWCALYNASSVPMPNVGYDCGCKGACPCKCSSCPCPPPPSALGWNTTILSGENGAVCLDGSPGGYHIQHRDNTAWTIHLQGGGWCTSISDCLKRASTQLGSSKTYPTDMDRILEGFDGGAHGIFSSNRTINPRFYNHTKAWLRYCDG